MPTVGAGAADRVGCCPIQLGALVAGATTQLVFTSVHFEAIGPIFKTDCLPALGMNSCNRCEPVPTSV